MPGGVARRFRPGGGTLGESVNPPDRLAVAREQEDRPVVDGDLHVALVVLDAYLVVLAAFGSP